MKYNMECRTAKYETFSAEIPGTELEKYVERVYKEFKNPRRDFINIGFKFPYLLKRTDIMFFRIKEVE